jgi:uncharacterized membrane protein YhaH (DUF805 family)
MGKKRLTIPILGGIFFSVIIIGSAVQTGDYSMLWAIFVTLLFLLFLYLHKKRVSDIEKSCNKNNQRFPLLIFIVAYVLLIILAILPRYLGILTWHRH